MGNKERFVGLDVKAMRTQRGLPVWHGAFKKQPRDVLASGRQRCGQWIRALVSQYRDARDYEALELYFYILKHLMGLR